MRCWKCGEAYSEGAVFCTACGVRVTPEDVATTRIRRAEMPPVATRPEPTGWSLPEPATGWSDPEPARHRERQRWIAATAVATALTLVIVIGVGWWLWEAREGGEEATLVLEGLSEDSIHEAWAVDVPAGATTSAISEEHATVWATEVDGAVVVVAPGESDRLIALDPDSGEVLWSKTFPPRSWILCHADDDLVACIESSTGDDDDVRVIAFNADDGKLRFRTPWEEDVSDVRVEEGAVFVLQSPYSTDDGPEPVSVKKYSSGGEELWEGGDVSSRVAEAPYLRFSDERIGVTSAQGADGRHLVFDMETGELVDDRGFGFLVGLPFVGAWSAEESPSEDVYGMDVLAPGKKGMEVMGTGEARTVDRAGDSRRVVISGEDDVRMYSASPESSYRLWTEDGNFLGACEGVAFVGDGREIVARSDDDGRQWTARLRPGQSAESAFCGQDRVLMAGWEGNPDDTRELTLQMVARDSGREVWRAPVVRDGGVVAKNFWASPSGFTEVYARSDGSVHVRRFEW